MVSVVDHGREIDTGTGRVDECSGLSCAGEFAEDADYVDCEWVGGSSREDRVFFPAFLPGIKRADLRARMNKGMIERIEYCILAFVLRRTNSFSVPPAFDTPSFSLATSQSFVTSRA